MPTIQAQDVVNAVIQDSQIQTTNRAALYDYTDRIHQRILRESKWRFLLSDPQVFVTMPGVSDYTVISGTPPPGSFQPPNLLLTDFKNVAPGTVFNLTTWSKIEEDPDDDTTLNYIILRDGSLRYGVPRTYYNLLSDPGTISLKPVPDDQNLYYPVPETPVVTYAPGGNLPNRIYYGVVTFVDNFGGEGTPCAIPFTIAVPAGNLLTVESPNPAIGLIGGNQIIYGWWNLYIGYSVNGWTRQNQLPIAIGTNWTEGTLGITTGALQVPSMLAISPSQGDTYLSITNTAFLQTTNVGTPVLPQLWALIDTNGNWWEVTTNPSTGYLETVSVPPSPVTTMSYTVVYLTDTSGYATWAITVATDGQLQSQISSVPPSSSAINGQPPTAPTIQPLNAYVIQFRYYKSRNKIVNPTDVLQIPYEYKDIVIAGVNLYASTYANIGKPNGNPFIAEYKEQFNSGLAQIRRDLRAQFRKTDFVTPDVVSQYVVGNQQGIPTMGW